MSVQAPAPTAVPAPVRIGCSGWIYKHWRGLFYPETLPVKRWFALYASEFADPPPAAAALSPQPRGDERSCARIAIEG